MTTLNVRQAAQAAKCSEQTIQRWLLLKKMPGEQDALGQWSIPLTKEEVAALPIRRLKKNQAALLRSQNKSHSNGHAPKEVQHIVLALAKLTPEQRERVQQLVKRFSATDLALLYEL